MAKLNKLVQKGGILPCLNSANKDGMECSVVARIPVGETKAKQSRQDNSGTIPSMSQGWDMLFN